VIFDFDFTLADSSAGAVECINYALRQVGLPEARSSRIHSSIGLSLAAGFEFVSGLKDPERGAEYARHFIEHADRVMADLTVVYDCVPEMLETLRARGLRLGIVSTKFRYRIQGILDREGLTEQFDVIVGGEDTTQHKPAPESLLLALEQHGPRCGRHSPRSVDAAGGPRFRGVPQVARAVRVQARGAGGDVNPLNHRHLEICAFSDADSTVGPARTSPHPDGRSG
jgi:phosphoglycolate phosphatase